MCTINNSTYNTMSSTIGTITSTPSTSTGTTGTTCQVRTCTQVPTLALRASGTLVPGALHCYAVPRAPCCYAAVHYPVVRCTLHQLRWCSWCYAPGALYPALGRENGHKVI